MDDSKKRPAGKASTEDAASRPEKESETKKKRLDPTRYGDWEKDGRCIDF